MIMKTYFILIPVMERLTNVVFHEGMLKLANDASEDEIAMALRESLLEKMPDDEINDYTEKHPIAIYCDGKWWIYKSDNLEEMK